MTHIKRPVVTGLFYSPGKHLYQRYRQDRGIPTSDIAVAFLKNCISTDAASKITGYTNHHGQTTVD